MNRLLRRTLVRFVLYAALWLPTVCIAQTKDSIDHIVFSVPKDWESLSTESYRQLTFHNKDKTFCQLVIYQTQPSSGNKQTDFNTEWKELIEKNFTVLTFASPLNLKTKKGSSFQRLGAKATDQNGNKYYVQLNVFDCGNSIQSVIAVSNTQKDLQRYDSLWQSLIINIKQNKAGSSVTVNTPVSAEGKTIVGKWAKSASSLPQYQNGVLVNLVNAGYHKGQYDFKANGTYTFHGESQFSSNDFALTDEKGTYTVTGNQLNLSPASSYTRKVDLNGTLKKTEQLPLTKRTYRWALHYFEGIQETNLVLSAVAENMLDGGYGSSSQFPNSFLYSREFIPEWRFKIQ
jgi:hypothetical protein